MNGLRIPKGLQSRGIPIIKTKSSERIDQLQHGCVYCKTLQYYIDLERIKGDQVIGDAWEASLPIRDAVIYLPSDGHVEKIENAAIPTTAKNNYVYCMTGVKYDKNKDENILADKGLTDFGDTSLIILDAEDYIERLRKAADNEEVELIRHDFVNYYDEKDDNIIMLQDIMKSTSNAAFWKRKKYETQSEYRFLFSGNGDRDHIELDIGDITDISIRVSSDQIQRVKLKHIEREA